MYESYFDKLRDECYLRNRTARTADAYISNITYFLKNTGKHPDELTLEDARNYLIAKKKDNVSVALLINVAAKRLIDDVDFVRSLRAGVIKLE